MAPGTPLVRYLQPGSFAVDADLQPVADGSRRAGLFELLDARALAAAAKTAREYRGFRVTYNLHEMPRRAIAVCGLGVAVESRPGRGGPEARVFLRLQRPAAMPWLEPVPDDVFQDAVFALLEGWPFDRYLWVRSGSDALADIVLLAVPDPTASADRGSASAIVATALYDIAVRGKDPATAIRRAHERPVPELALPAKRHRVSGGGRKIPWLAGRLRLPQEVAFLLDGSLFDAWREDSLAGGFRVEVDSGFRVQGRALLARDGQAWLAAGRVTVWATWQRFSGPGSVLGHVHVTWEPQRPWADPAVATVVLAWPDGDKALLLPRNAIVQPVSGLQQQAHVGLRLGDAPLDTVEVVFEHVMRAAVAGTPAEEMRRWLASLDQHKLGALKVLRALG
ncbi:MAG TPA: hypothetical protein VIK99_04305 [Thermaerobacter sp.]